ncbi:hypothetical protein TBR22_A02610 [Luteitalea sp. TBR-22]|uniref:DUF4401 domain-containing protein n=1 Tax=Luteitalea sp. TBR-22 TaxID=2802971 RepID=UPI001AFAEE01|nr:DUF4401 domain-containing protein [Luteitalea sp. TBR-22]BCS31061.1 hypothetical protein TBR22_A02610 [Luteitalea sp. TBR-22]
MIARRTLAQVLQEGTALGLVPAGIETDARAAVLAMDHEDMPWYLRVLMGGAAWVGALFLLASGLGIVSVILGERVDLAALVLGIGLMPLGIALRGRKGGELVRQSSLVCVFAGQMLLLGAIGSITDGVRAPALAAIASSLVLILLYEDGVYRFCATLLAVGSAVYLAVDARVPYAMGAATALLALAPVVAWRLLPATPRWHRVLDPAAWACALAACGLLTLQIVIDVVTGTVGFSPDFVKVLLPQPWPLTVVFVVALGWLALRVAADHRRSPASHTTLVAIVAVCLVGGLTWSTPAITGALLLVMLGFDRRRTGLIAVGAAFLIGFLGLYYYSLSLTLLQKSGVLVASGLVCLAAAAFFRRHVEGVEA